MNKVMDQLVPCLLDVHFSKGRENQDVLNVIFSFNFYHIYIVNEKNKFLSNDNIKYVWNTGFKTV